MIRPLVTVSVDVDPVDLHLLGYGYRGLPADPTIYSAALPRMLELFERYRIAATFFIVGRDADRHAATVRSIASAGHEVASHSFSHPFSFARLNPTFMRRELLDSRTALEMASGRTVVGYRSPNFDMDDRGLEALAECGYRYDASGYPTPMLFPARLLLALKSRKPEALMQLTCWPFSMRREPFRWQAGAKSLIEFPVSVTPGIRLPIYHTARYYMSDDRFERILDGIVARGETLSYPIHAVDTLGFAEDRVDSRLGRHPGMSVPLDRKLQILDRTLRAIAMRFEPVTFEKRVANLNLDTGSAAEPMAQTPAS